MHIPVVAQRSAVSNQQNTLELQPGQTYRGTVVSVDNNVVLLRIGGMLIQGSGHIPLQPGQLLTLRAEQFDPSTLMLKVLPTHEPPSLTSGMEQAFTQLGLSPTPENLAAARALLVWMQPLSESDIKKLSKEAKEWPPDKQEAFLSVRGWSKAADLPQDTISLRAITRFLLGQAEPEEIAPALRHINSGSRPEHYPTVNVLWWQSEFNHGELYVFDDSGPSYARQSVHTVALRVQTNYLGEVWVSVSHNNKKLNLTFYTAENNSLQVLRSARASFTSALTSLGFSLSVFSVRQQDLSSFLDIMPPVTEPYRGINLIV